MMTQFSQEKLAEAQEKKAKGGLLGGFLSRKHQGENEPSKDDVVVTSSVAKFQDHRTASPTSSLEPIVSPRGGSKSKAMSKVSIASFWEDTETTTQKSHVAISVEDLEPLMGKPHSELMSSHVHNLMQVYVLVSYAHFFFVTYLLLQVLGESLYISGKYLDYDKKLVEAQSRIASLFAENESLTIQISALANKAKKDKDHLKTLEKNINIEKAFLKLKDKQIEDKTLIY